MNNQTRYYFLPTIIIHYWYRTGYHYSQAGHNKDAFVWMMRAAKAGHSSAQNNIGLSYLHGLFPLSLAFILSKLPLVEIESENYWKTKFHHKCSSK
jgi:TPR repeat protein